MFVSRRITSPSTIAPGTVSCIRLRHRSRVDFPQPEGPMIAVTERSWKSRLTLRSTRARPNHALSRLAEMMADFSSDGSLSGTALTETSTRGSSVTGADIPTSRCIARYETDHKHNGDENERPCPCLSMSRFVRADCVIEDLQRKCRNRLAKRRGPELISESGKEQRCRFPCDARDRHERSGNDARECRAQNDRHRRPPVRVAESEGSFTQ